MSFLHTRSVLRDAAGDAAAAAAAGGGGGGGGGDAAAQAAAAAAAAAAKPEPFYKGLYGDDGKFDKKAFERLPDGLKEHRAWLEKYDGIESALLGGANAHKMAVGKIPGPLKGDEAPAVLEERSKFLDTVNNVPAKPEDYGLTREKVAKDLPEQYWDQALADSFAGVAKKHHLSPEAVKDIMALQLGSTQAQIAKGQSDEAAYYDGQQKAFEEAMKKDAIDLEKANDLATRAAATFGVDPKGAIFKNAQMRQTLVRAAMLVSESKLKSGDGARVGEKGNPIEQARDIARNPQNPEYKAFNDPVHPDHQRVKDKWNALYRTAPQRDTQPS